MLKKIAILTMVLLIFGMSIYPFLGDEKTIGIHKMNSSEKDYNMIERNISKEVGPPTGYISTTTVEYCGNNGHYYVTWCEANSTHRSVFFAYSDDLEQWTKKKVCDLEYYGGYGRSSERTGRYLSIDISDSEIALVSPSDGGGYTDFDFIKGSIKDDGSVDWDEKVHVSSETGPINDVVIFNGNYFVSTSGDWSGSWRSASIYFSSDGVNWEKIWKSNSGANYGGTPGHFQRYNDSEDLMFLFFHDYDQSDMRAVYYNNSTNEWENEENIGYDKRTGYHTKGIGSLAYSNEVHITWQGPNRNLLYGTYSNNSWSESIDLSEKVDEVPENIETPNIFLTDQKKTIVYKNRETGNLDILSYENDNWSITMSINSYNETIGYPNVCSEYPSGNWLVLFSEENDYGNYNLLEYSRGSIGSESDGGFLESYWWLLLTVVGLISLITIMIARKRKQNKYQPPRRNYNNVDKRRPRNQNFNGDRRTRKE